MLAVVHPRWVAAMPDVHWGIGATVGSVIPTKGAIIPSAVGVDIGCGMMAIETSLNASHLPDTLKGSLTPRYDGILADRSQKGLIRASSKGIGRSPPLPTFPGLPRAATPAVLR